MAGRQVTCQRCGAVLRAVAFLDLEKDAKGNVLDVYCGPCSKFLEREELRSWARKWSRSLTGEADNEAFFSVLAAVWEQGFVKARTYEEAAPVYAREDNPLLPQVEEAPPAVEELHAPPPPTPPVLDEDSYYEQNPVFRSGGQ